MCKIKVIHYRDADFDDVYTVYIGRKFDGKESIWQNPFRIEKGFSRNAVLQKYYEYITWLIDTEKCYRNEQRYGIIPSVCHHCDLKRLKELAEMGTLKLVCWCAPKACHGDILKDQIMK